MHDASTQEANDVSSKITDKSNIETLAAQAVACLFHTLIHKRGALSQMCNSLTTEIWKFFIKHISHLSGAHIPDKHVIADLSKVPRLCIMDGWSP